MGSRNGQYCFRHSKQLKSKAIVMADANVHEMRVTVVDEQIIFTYLTTYNSTLFQRDTFKMELSVARIFHRVLNEYRRLERKIFEKSDYEILGKSLAKMLFDYPIVTQTLAEPIKSVQRDTNSRFRIYLDFKDNAGEIALLPWEYLMLEGLGKDVQTFFPAADRNSQFDLIRSISPKKAQPFDFTIVPNAKLQVILIKASTTDNTIDKITWDKWFTSMKDNFLNDIEFYTIEEPTQENINLQLDEYVNNIEGPYIVHYVGHAKVEEDEGYISLVDDNSASFWMPDVEFAKLFRQYSRRSPHVVILQACYSGQITRFDATQKSGIAMQVAYESSVPAVIAMQNEITEEVGFTFVTKFYKSLAAGDDVAKATTKGRTYLGCSYKEKQTVPDYASNIFGTPVLFLTSSQPFALTSKPSLAGNDSTINKKCTACEKIWKKVPNKKICGFNGCKGALVIYKESDTGITDKMLMESATISNRN